MSRVVQQGIYRLWQRLIGPWLLAAGGLLGLGITLAVALLPQLPGQLIDEPATAARWMQEASIDYGVWGNLWLALGLFNALHSPLLYLALALIVPALAAQAAAALARLRQLTTLRRGLAHLPPVTPGETVPLPVDQALRRRFVVDAPVRQVVAQLHAAADLRAPALQSEFVPPADHPPLDARDEDADQEEEARLSAVQLPTQAWLRPLLPLGMLIAVTALWAALVWGWQVAAPPLAPGATYRVIGQQLALTYTPSLTPTLASALRVNFRGEKLSLAVDRAQVVGIGGATLSLAPVYPALWVATADGAAQLSLPGRADPQPAVGIVFAGNTTEESVLLPEQGAGLRVVRRSAPTPGFVLELYRSDEVQPVYRAELPATGRVVIPLARTNLELVVTTLPGLLVNVHYLPNLWLTWVGLALAVAGAAAYLGQAGWLVVQAAPWPRGRTVVIVQSSHARWIDAISRVERMGVPATDTPRPEM